MTKEEQIIEQNEHEVDNQTDNVQQVEFDRFPNDGAAHIPTHGDPTLDILKDIEVEVSVELGRISMPIGNVLQLVKGSVVELENLAGEPIDIMVNGLKIAQGEVVVIDEHFGVRITKMITTKAIMSAVS
ncbi:flagellar motor switch protein FliN [Balneolaceae bacterium]|nr:flagellar motor switch protein FliN [Balneolaceae bacterium]